VDKIEIAVGLWRGQRTRSAWSRWRVSGTHATAQAETHPREISPRNSLYVESLGWPLSKISHATHNSEASFWPCNEYRCRLHRCSFRGFDQRPPKTFVCLERHTHRIPVSYCPSTKVTAARSQVMKRFMMPFSAPCAIGTWTFAYALSAKETSGKWKRTHAKQRPPWSDRSTGGPPRSEEMSDQTFDRKIITWAEREARRVFAAAEAKKSISDYEKAQKAFHENRERLRTERLAREAEALKKKAVVQGEERWLCGLYSVILRDRRP